MTVDEQRTSNLGGCTGKGFLPGQSGNPGGRPKGKSITAELRKIIDQGTNAEDMAQILYDIAKSKLNKNQLTAFRELLDRTDGKVPDTHRIEGDIPVNLVYKLVERKEDATE